MRQHPIFPANGQLGNLPTPRGVVELTAYDCWLITKNIEAFTTSAIKIRSNGGIDERIRPEFGDQGQLMVHTHPDGRNDPSRCENAVTDTGFPRPRSIPLPTKEPQTPEKLKFSREFEGYRPTPTGTHGGNIRDAREVGNEKDLSGPAAYERARLTFVRRGMQMFRDAADDGLLRRDWLLHQKACEHRGGGFVEPLFEKSINFLF
jgi:hypothetical protein